MVKGGKKTKERKKSPTKSCTQCNSLATSRLGSCAWSIQPLFDPCICTTLNCYYIVKAFNVITSAFQVSSSNGSYVFGIFETTHTNPSSFNK
jgi:hypothetical protein